MKILSLHHVPFEGLGSLSSLIQNSNHSLHTVKLWEQPALPDPGDFDLLIIMGGPMDVRDIVGHSWLAEEKRFIKEAIGRKMKILGICLGAQLLAEALGGSVAPGMYREIGWHEVSKGSEAVHCALGRALPDRFLAFHWHGDCFSIPPGAVALGYSAACATQGFVWQERVVALQFHLEATLASVADLLQNCHGEVDASGPCEGCDPCEGCGPYVQSPQVIAGTPADFQAVNTLMELVWDTLVSG